MLSEKAGLHLHPAASSHERAVAPRATLPPALGVGHSALPATLTLLVLALVNLTIWPGLLASTVLLVVLPLALVNSTIRPRLLPVCPARRGRRQRLCSRRRGGLDLRL